MKIAFAASFAILAFVSTQLWAQESLVGRYNGSYEALSYGNMIKMGMTVVISSAENGQVKGVATRQRGSCRGDYPFEGTLKGNQLVLKGTAKGGLASDCSFGWRAAVEGNKLSGKFGPSIMELSK